MCGIAGCVVAPGLQPDRDALGRMARALVHRGPDDEGIVVDGNVGLVHRRLAIVDPSPAGHQPMSTASGEWRLTYNGEVFNHLELREQLGGPWAGGCDTETVLRALDTWGAAALPQFNGLFGLAALDRRRNRLLLARDRWGVKPLYVAWHDGALWFASEIRALLAGGVPRRADVTALTHAIQLGWVNGPVTPVERVRRVLPGTMLEVDLSTLAVEEHTFYDPTWVVDAERARELERVGDDERLALLEDALRTAVDRRLMADVPVGVMCSGGIDSSITTMLAAGLQPGMRAYHASIADQPEADESPFAARVAELAGAQLRTVRTDATSWRADFVDVVAHTEYPLLHPSSVPMAQIARLAREDGVKVLLSGEGADELFGGYPWVHAPQQRDWLAADRRFNAPLRTLWRRLNRLGVGDVEGPPEGPCEEVTEFDRATRRRASAAYAHHRGARRRLEAALLGDLGSYLPHLLNRQDRTTMAHSIETRVPFLDPDLAALAVNLPLEQRSGPPRKRALRDVARRLGVPADLVDRAKVGFGFDVAGYIDDAADPEFLLDGRLREELGVSAADWRANVPGVGGHWPLALWSAEVWCRVLLDDQDPATVSTDLWSGA